MTKVNILRILKLDFLFENKNILIDYTKNVLNGYSSSLDELILITKLGNKKLRDVAQEVKPTFENGKRLTYGSLANELGDLGYSFTDSILRRIYSFLIE